MTTMRPHSLPRIETTFSLSPDTDASPTDLRILSKKKPPPIRIPSAEENASSYGLVLHSLSEANKMEITQYLRDPVAVLFRESADPKNAITAFSNLENKHFHPDRGDDRLLQVLVDNSPDAGIVTIYVLPANYVLELRRELQDQNLTLIKGSHIIMRRGRIDTYDPSHLIQQEFGLEIGQRLYIVDTMRKSRQSLA